MAMMNQARHEMLKAKWIEIVREQRNSGLAVRKWCEQHQISTSSFFYWSRVIRQDSLVKAGILAVTNQPCFAEVTPERSERSTVQTGICAVLRFRGTEMEIHNGADPITLDSLLHAMGRLE